MSDFAQISPDMLHKVTRDIEAEQVVLRLLNREAPDLVPMVLGGVL